MRFYVYIWKDPKDGVPRYIGKGQGKRVWAHIDRPSNARISHLLCKRYREGYVCLPQIIWVDSEAQALELEVFLIAEIGREDLGYGPLFNLTDGGDGKNLSSETRAKISAARSNPSPETRAKLSAVAARRTYSTKTRAKISAAQKGRSFSAEHRAKLSAAKNGKLWTENRRKALCPC